MTVKNIQTKIKPKATNSNKTKIGGIKKETKTKGISNIKNSNSKKLFIIIMFTSVLLIVSSYAWLSASLDVKIKFFDLVVSSDSGLFISLDGIDFSDSVEISINSVIRDLTRTYPNHTNQWAAGGLWPVSSNGIRNGNRDKFDIYGGEVSRLKSKVTNRRFLNTKLLSENKLDSYNKYIAFDLFLKNVSGSPKSDNLYLDEGTYIDFEDNTDDDTMTSMSNVINSMRFGFVRIGSTSSKSDVNTIQNLTCNSNCQMVIFEPHSTSHSPASIEKATEYGVTLLDGVYFPTYAVINEGEFLEHASGHIGTGLPLDTAHFALQKTIKESDLSKPIFQIPNGITKFRAYVWIEGQDIDSLETNSAGAAISLAINLIKDLAGYE